MKKMNIVVAVFAVAIFFVNGCSSSTDSPLVFDKGVEGMRSVVVWSAEEWLAKHGSEVKVIAIDSGRALKDTIYFVELKRDKR